MLPRPLVASDYRPRDYLLRRTLAAADLAGCALVLGLAAAMASAASPSRTALILVPALPATLVLFRLYGLYDRDIKRISLSVLDDLPALSHAVMVGTVALWAYLRIVAPEIQPSPGDLVLFAVAAVAALSASRLAARRLFLHLSGPSRVLLVGDSDRASELVRKMRSHPRFGLEPVGEVTVAEPTEVRLPWLGRLGAVDLTALAIEHRVDRVIVCATRIPRPEMMELVVACGAAGAKVSIMPGDVEFLGPSVEIDDLEGTTMLGLNPPVLDRTSRCVKRAMDIAGAAFAIVLLAPLMAVAAAAIALDSGRPILFRQRRIGRGGKPFTMLKLRTMEPAAEARVPELAAASSDPGWLRLDHDPRVTRAGRILRLLSLDEVPQLLNVLRGEMSLVGPRPLIPSEDRRIDGWERSRLDLAPGITGMWQVLGRTEIPFREMLKLDCLYVTNWSLWLDVKLIAQTLPAVLARRGAN
jgi:exopolysaccharide biosynthesis polyprenyl glycosylphosphotransferase